MPKNSVSEYDLNPDNNTDIAGLGITGASGVGNFDNAFRILMAQLRLAFDLVSTGGLSIKGSGNRTITFADASGAARGYLFQDSTTEDLILSRVAGGTLRMSGSLLAYSAAMQAGAFNVLSDGNRGINFGTTAGVLKGFLFQDNVTDDLILMRASGETLRMSTTSLRYNGTLEAAFMRVLSDANRNLTFASANGTARGFLFSDSGTNDMLMSLATGQSARLSATAFETSVPLVASSETLKSAGNRILNFANASGAIRGYLFQDAGTDDLLLARASGETLRMSTAWLDYSGVTQSRGQRVISDNNRAITFASLNGTARGYLFQDAATDDMILSKADGTATMRIGGVGFTYNGASVTLLGDIRARHIANGAVDNFVAARLSADGSTKPVLGSDYAGSALITPDAAAPYGFGGAWRCLSLINGAAPWIGLFYRIA